MSSSETNTVFWMLESLTPWDIHAHGITKVILQKKTPYQELTIVETGAYGKTLVLDGVWQSSVKDEFLYHEPLVQPAMIYHGNPRKVLIIGGGEGATAREVLRWKTVERVVMVELDQEVAETCREYLPEMHTGAFADPRLELVIDDARNFLNTTSQEWDVVISDLSDPDEEGTTSTLFTTEYFSQIRRVLKPNGIFATYAGSIEFSVNLPLSAQIVRTINAVFPYVLPYSSYVPSLGEAIAFVVASVEEITPQLDPAVVTQLLEAKTTGNLRMLDGGSLMGLMQVPLYIRQEIASETKVYTLEEPPKWQRLSRITSQR